MNKKLSVLLACAIILMSGCTTTENTEKETESEATTSAAETTSVNATTTAPEAETTTASETAKEELSLSDIGVENLSIKDVDYHDGSNTILTAHIEPDAVNIISDNSLELISGYSFYVRPSTNLLYTDGDSINAIPSSEFSEYTEFASPYDIEWKNPVITYMSNKDYIDYVELSYEIKNQFKVNAFIKKNGNNAEIIIDPAYMYNIPLFSDRASLNKFTINDTNVTADALSVDCTYGKDAEQISSENYVYAEVYLSDFVCTYNTDNGYTNSAVITNTEVISENTKDFIDNAIFTMSEDKDPKMIEVYNAILSEKDKLLTDDTYGIVLLDMDFDGMPEVLHTKFYNTKDDYVYNLTSDIEIYRVKEGSLKYIDTIYNQHMAVYSISNLLGIKNLEDGSKAWFATSYKNRTTGENNVTDYLYTLNGDKLEYTELFTSKPFGEPNEHGYYEYKYYFKGSEIVPTVIHEELTEEELQGPYSDTHYEWNGAYSYFGEMWELYGKARGQYTSDIEISYKMYSDWLSNIYSDPYYNNSIEKYELTDREFAYNIAYLVDEFFLGEYNSAQMEYNYNFLGDYAKPVIYLYPEEETEVSVEVEFAEGGEFTCTYPEYGEGWNVKAMPDGTLYDEDGNEYYCLYWEGDGKADFDMSKGFCVKGEDTADFLREKLMHIGLTAREANEFIIYWLPIMQENEYNVITFHIDDYIKSVPMTVTPAPDTVIRVFMTFTPSDEYIAIEEQTLPSYERNGFTVVEWGGGECETIS